MCLDGKGEIIDGLKGCENFYKGRYFILQLITAANLVQMQFS